MDNSILNVEQATEFLGISEKTLIKLLREEHVPARKVGREWRFSKASLMDWLAKGDSTNYISQNDYYSVSEDEEGETAALLGKIQEKTGLLLRGNQLRSLLKSGGEIMMPGEATLRISYKQQRDVEKLEFKLFWPMREEYRSLSGAIQE